MAFKRATKAGQVIRIPLLSDPDYQARRLSRDSIAEVEAEEHLFFESIDPSALKTDLNGVTQVAIRGLSGKDFTDIQDKVLGLIESSTAPSVLERLVSIEIIRKGLVKVDGFDGSGAESDYPVEVLNGVGGLGEMWPRACMELTNRIRVWSSLGESTGSP